MITMKNMTTLPKVITINLEDVKAILQTYEGKTLYPMTISHIIKDIRKMSLEQKNQGFDLMR